MEISLESISSILDAYSSLEEVTKVAPIQNKKSKDLIKDFYTEVNKTKHKVRLSPRKDFSKDMQTLFKNAKLNGEYILRELEDLTNEVIVSEALNAVKANLLRAVAHYYFMTEYALDTANYIYINEVEETDVEISKEAKLNKQQVAFLEKNMWIFGRLILVYGDEPSEFKLKVKKLGDVYLPKEESDEIVELYEADKVDIFHNLPQGFIGSPIYSIRMIFAEWSATRYKELKNKKKLLELRYLYLKVLQEKGDYDIGLEKEIESIQKQLTDIDYSISKIEKSVED
jgi:hypothetical protein